MRARTLSGSNGENSNVAFADDALYLAFGFRVRVDLRGNVGGDDDDDDDVALPFLFTAALRRRMVLSVVDRL